MLRSEDRPTNHRDMIDCNFSIEARGAKNKIHDTLEGRKVVPAIFTVKNRLRLLPHAYGLLRRRSG